MHLHLVFHCSLLEPCATSTIPHRIMPPPPVVQLIDGLEYEVAAILDSKIIRNKLYYLVDWLGYGPKIIRNKHITWWIDLDTVPRSSAISYITWWIGLDTVPTIVLGSLSTMLLMLKPLSMPSIASIRTNLTFIPSAS